jgi:predicted phosphoadenosine phosphosulfate sulfurtransferase
MALKKKIRKFIDTNVYDEAIKRINHIYDVFDTVVVMFSGGKDSLATLHLCKEVADARGHKKVNVVFRDQELIPNVVVDFVNKYRELDWVDMKYFCVQTYATKYVLGQTQSYIQWDADREHMRPMPTHAITDKHVFDRTTMDAFTASFYKGKLAFVNGIRASESLRRYGSCMEKLNENYINATKGTDRVKLCKPIFDWQEDDVFKYFYDNDIEYCSIYDRQMWNQENLRVDTPVHHEASKRFFKLKTRDPLLYQQVVDLFPEMIIQDKYYAEYNQETLKEKYGQDLQTILDYIKDYITEPRQKNLAYERFKQAVVAHRKSPDAYPIYHLLTFFMSGEYKRKIYPINKYVYEKRADRTNKMD